MKILTTMFVLLTLVLFSISANALEEIEKYWERGCGVNNTVDDVRNMAVWAGGDILATINRTAGSDAIKLYNATSGLQEEIIEHLDMTGIPAVTYSICSGDFSEDGAFFASSLSHTTGVDLEVYYWASIDATPVKILDQVYSTRLGDALDVTGKVSDNSVLILIGGNAGTSVPVKITYDGSTWTPTTFANAVRATDIHQVAGGKFYATYPGGEIVRYNSDGTVDATVTSGALSQTSIAVDEAEGLIYSCGYYSTSTATYTNHLKVYDESTGNILADLSGDPIDVLGNFTGTANGSSAIELVKYASGTYAFAMSERNGCARYSYSTVLTVGSTGDFPTIQGAISSYCITGGTQTGVYKPLVIAIDPASGPYDEALNLSQSALGVGDIAGDIVLKATGSAKAVVKLQGSPDALYLRQNSVSMIFKNIIFCPSQITPPSTNIFMINEVSANTDMNWVELYGCIITDILVSGDPMITTPAEALTVEPSTSGAGFGLGDSFWRTTITSYSLSYFFEQSVVYGNWHMFYMYLWGDDSQCRIHNSIIAQSQSSAIFTVSNNNTHQLIITGDDQTEGIVTGDTINCSALYQFDRRSHGVYAGGVNGMFSVTDLILVVKNSIFHSTTGGDGAIPITSSGGVGVGPFHIYKIHDVIFESTATAVSIIRDQFINPDGLETDIRNATIKGTCPGILFLGTSTKGVDVTDSIFADCTAAVSEVGGVSVSINLTNCGLPEVGETAIGSVTNSTNVVANVISAVTDDPIFISLDPLSSDYMDVNQPTYGGAGSGGSDLAGGADFIGTEVRSWSLY